MSKSHRPGKIAGMLVVLLLLILIPTWAVGHWINGAYPVAASEDTSVDNSAIDSDSENDPENIFDDDPENNADDPEVGDDPAFDSDTGSDMGTAAFGAGAQDQAEPQETATREPQETVDVAALKSAVDEANAKADESQKQLELATNRAKKQARDAEENTNRLTKQNEDLTKKLAVQDQRLIDLEKQIKVAMAATAAPPLVVKQPEPAVVPELSELKRERPWTAITGQVVNATFTGIEGDVVLLAAKGKVFRVPLSKLAEADRKIAAQLNKLNQ